EQMAVDRTEVTAVGAPPKFAVVRCRQRRATAQETDRRESRGAPERIAVAENLIQIQATFSRRGIATDSRHLASFPVGEWGLAFLRSARGPSSSGKGGIPVNQ